MAVQEPLVPHHQVFLNFRGEELRNGFVSYLETALKNAGINVFIDKDEMRGEDLTVLFRRIEESKIALVVFSRRYMESKWCLNELVKIKECVEEKKLVAFPIFFKVNPIELEELFYDAREIHSNVQTHIMEKWKVALECIKSKMGLTLKEQRYCFGSLCLKTCYFLWRKSLDMTFFYGKQLVIEKKKNNYL